MNDVYRLNLDDLNQVLETWNERLRRKVFLAACGGSALALYGYKEITRDVDFRIPDLDQFDLITKLISTMDYVKLRSSRTMQNKTVLPDSGFGERGN